MQKLLPIPHAPNGPVTVGTVEPSTLAEDEGTSPRPPTVHSPPYHTPLFFFCYDIDTSLSKHNKSRRKKTSASSRHIRFLASTSTVLSISVRRLELRFRNKPPAGSARNLPAAASKRVGLDKTRSRPSVTLQYRSRGTATASLSRVFVRPSAGLLYLSTDRMGKRG